MPISGGFHRGVEVQRQTNCPIFRHVCLCASVCVCVCGCVQGRKFHLTVGGDNIHKISQELFLKGTQIIQLKLFLFLFLFFLAHSQKHAALAKRK